MATKFAQSELDPAKQKAGYHRHDDTLPLLVPVLVLSLKSPTGAFIAALRFANAVPPQTLPGTSTANWNLSFSS